MTLTFDFLSWLLLS